MLTPRFYEFMTLAKAYQDLGYTEDAKAILDQVRGVLSIAAGKDTSPHVQPTPQVEESIHVEHTPHVEPTPQVEESIHVEHTPHVDVTPPRFSPDDVLAMVVEYVGPYMTPIQWVRHFAPDLPESQAKVYAKLLRPVLHQNVGVLLKSSSGPAQIQVYDGKYRVVPSQLPS